MDIINNLGTIIFTVVPIIFFLWLIIAQPIIKELKEINEKLTQLTKKTEEKSKDE